jgi:hypothetical protein
VTSAKEYILQEIDWQVHQRTQELTKARKDRLAKAQARAKEDLAKREAALKKEIAELKERQRWEALAELTTEHDLRKEYQKRARGEK